MKKIVMFSLAAVAIFGFAGCGDADPRTVDYFENNLEIAKKRVDECKKMERMSEKTKEDCQNAQSAISRFEAQKQKQMINLQTIFSDFEAYFVSQGKFDSVEKMTNVPLPLKIGNSVCAEFSTKSSNELEFTPNLTDKNCAFLFEGSKGKGTFEIGYGDKKGKIIVK